MSSREPDGHHLGHRHRTGPPEGDWWPSRQDDPSPEPQRREWRGARHSTDEEDK